MKIALISDSHGELDPRVRELVRNCDVAVHAGDVGARGVLQSLKPRDRVVAIRGNNDTPAKWAAAEHRALDQLPWEALLDLPGGSLAVVHGHRHGRVSQRHERLRRDFPEARCIVYGHSHRLICDTGARPWVINPGACGRSRTFGGPSCVLLYAGFRRWRLEVKRIAKIQ